MSYRTTRNDSFMSAKMNNYNFSRVLFVVLAIQFACCSERKIQVLMNPNCDSICDENNITTVYLRSEGPNDALHYIWDFSGKPSILLAVTGPSAQLAVNWARFLYGKENSIQFTEIPKYSFGMTVLKIYEFNDVNDTGFITDASRENINVLNPKKFNWERKNFSHNSDYYELSMEGTNYASRRIQTDGSIKFLLNRFWTSDHSDIMPHLLHTENASQVDIVFDNFHTNSSFEKSRFAIELFIIANNNINSTMHIDMKKTLDDEHTPGIFQMVQLTTPISEFVNSREASNRAEEGGYLQWRPVSYTAADRDVTSSTEAVYYPLTKVTNRIQTANNSLLYSFYGYKIENMLLQKMNVSLGTKGDGFYHSSNYSSWTFTIGYGTPPNERFSLLVIMIISIGLGVPSVIIIASIIYICARRRYKRGDAMSLNS